MAVLTAGVIGLALSLTLSKAELAAWGWRVPALLSLLLVPVGLYLRSKMPETLDDRPVESGSWSVTLGKQSRLILLSVLIILGGTVSTYVGNYMTTYAIATLHFQPSTALAATVVGIPATGPRRRRRRDQCVPPGGSGRSRTFLHQIVLWQRSSARITCSKTDRSPRRTEQQQVRASERDDSAPEAL